MILVNLVGNDIVDDRGILALVLNHAVVFTSAAINICVGKVSVGHGRPEGDIVIPVASGQGGRAAEVVEVSVEDLHDGCRSEGKFAFLRVRGELVIA